MRINLVFVGKTGFHDLDSAIGRYLERLNHYCQLEVHYVRAEKLTAKMTDELVRTREGARIQKLTGSQGTLIVWDQRGRELNSVELSRVIQSWMDSGTSVIWMVIGGPVGVSSELLKGADSVLSLSKMTFPHDLARLMLVEQLYRAFTILRGEPYHR